MSELSKFQILQIVGNIVGKHGCKLLEFNLEKKIINIDGPPAAQAKCAEELDLLLSEENRE